MRRLLIASTAVLGLVSGAAGAQDRPTLWSLLSIDRIVQGALHSGIAMIRTQMDLQYEDLTVDLRRSRVAMTGVTAWPFLDWDLNAGCKVEIDQITLFSTPIDMPEQITVKARASGVTVTRDCLPPDTHEVLDMAGVDDIVVPRLTLDVDYGVPKSDALMRVYAEIADVATVDLTGDFAYFWFDTRNRYGDPMPAWFLRSATLAVENHGAWEALSGLLPPTFTGAGSERALAGLLTEGMIELNREGDPEADGISDEQQAFLDTLTAAWPDFLENPETLVLETAIDGDIYLDFSLFEDDPAEIFATLQPRVALAPGRVGNMLPAELLRSAMGEGAAELTDEERRRVGTALVTGEGAPRNVARGTALLEPLAEGGDGAASLALAHALMGPAPEDAYLWALRAGSAGEVGATAMLDRLEQALPFRRVLELQDQVSGADSHPGSALRTISGIREQASMRLSGKGLARSYGIAAMWAMLAKAAGDPEAADMLAEIDEIVRLEGPDAIAAWNETEAGYAALAMEVWIGQDLPERYAE